MRRREPLNCLCRCAVAEVGRPDIAHNCCRLPPRLATHAAATSAPPACAHGGGRRPGHDAAHFDCSRAPAVAHVGQHCWALPVQQDAGFDPLPHVGAHCEGQPLRFPSRSYQALAKHRDMRGCAREFFRTPWCLPADGSWAKMAMESLPQGDRDTLLARATRAKPHARRHAHRPSSVRTPALCPATRLSSPLPLFLTFRPTCLRIECVSGCCCSIAAWIKHTCRDPLQQWMSKSGTASRKRMRGLQVAMTHVLGKAGGQRSSTTTILGEPVSYRRNRRQTPMAQART